METPEKKGVPLVPAVEQASRVLLCLAGDPSGKMRLTDICNRVGIHKSKGYSILNTLQLFGFVRKDLTEKTYSLGPGLLSLSRKVLDNLNYAEIVGPSLKTLAGATRSTALFGTISNERLFVVAKQESDAKIGVTIALGHSFPLTWGAHGRAIVAFMNDNSRDRILSRKKLYFHGESGASDKERLRDELKMCRIQGYAFDTGQMNRGINAVASPVFGSGPEPIGAVFVIGTFPESLIPACGPVLVEKAVEISRLFGARTEEIFGIIGIKGARHV